MWVLAPFALQGLAREVDAAAGLLLHTTLDLPGFVPQALALLDGRRVALSVAVWTIAGAAAWLLLGWRRSRADRVPLAAALDREATSFGPLWLRPAITLLAIVSLALRPVFPYAFTLPVALTQDWGFAQDAAAVAALLAPRLPRLSLPAPASVAFVAFLGYALLVPEWSRHWEGHPGNEPKYLRTAIAAALWLDLDVGRVDASLEDLQPAPFVPALGRAASTVARAGVGLVQAAARGEDLVSADRVRDLRAAHLTVAGRGGGLYHVLAPGPSLLIAPALRADRALNRTDGQPGRLRLTLLLWNALAALLVAAVFALTREATGRPGLAAAVSAFFAVTPPFLFYFHQFYPELPAALVLTVCLKRLVFGRGAGPRDSLALGLLVGVLPWLHQKYLPLAVVLAMWAVWRAVDRLVPLGALLALVAPLAASAFLTLSFNFALTGSARPDALFLAAGMHGVTASKTGHGVPGLLLDANYGILPYAPVYLFALAGVALARGSAARLRLALPAAAVYYLTVASHDTWTGAISNLGRFVMPIAPLAVAFAAVALDRTAARRGVLALALTLGAWTAWCSRALWLDPHAANDAVRLLARSAFADPTVYLPNLDVRRLADASPALPAQLAVWSALALLLALYVRRAASGRGGDSPGRALAGLCVALLLAALALERWPSPQRLARLPEALRPAPGAVVFPREGACVEGGRLRLDAGRVLLLVRSARPLRELPGIVAGEGTLRYAGSPPVLASAGGTRLVLRADPLVSLRGRRGVEEHLQTAILETRPGAAGLYLTLEQR